MPPPQQHLLSPGVSIIVKAVLHSSFFLQVFLVLLVFLTFVIPLGSPSASSTSNTNTHAQQLKRQQQQSSVLSSKPDPFNLFLHHHHFSHEYSSSDSLLNPCPEASRWPEFCGPLLNTSILSETSKKALKEKVYIAKSMFCDKVRILNKIDCAQPFTVSPRWRIGCQEAYRDWSCSILVEDFIPEGLHSCDSTCHNVIRNCPYLSPDRVQADGRGPHPSQYGGHPAFFCPTNSLVNLQQSEHTEDFFFFWDENALLTCIIFNPSEAQLNWDSFPLTSIDLSNINFTFCHEYGSGTGDINAPVIVAGDSVVRVAGGGQDPSDPSSSDSIQQYLTIFPDIRKVNVSHCCWTYSSALPQLYTSLASTLRRKEERKEENCVELFSEDESSHLYEENIEPEQPGALAAQNQIVLQCFVGQETKTKQASSESITHHDFESGANNIDFPPGSDSTKLYDHYYDAEDEQFHHFYSHDDVLDSAPLVKGSVRVRRVDNNANNEGDHFSLSSSSGDDKANKNHGASARGNEGADDGRARRKNNRHKDSNNQHVYGFNGRHHSGDHHGGASEDEIRERSHAVEKSSGAMLLLDDQDYMLLDDDEDYNRDEPTTENSFASSSFSTADDFITVVTHASAGSESSSSSRKRVPKLIRGKREAFAFAPASASASAGSRIEPPLSSWLRKVNTYCYYMTSTLLLHAPAPSPETSTTATATCTSTTSCCFLLHNYWLFLLLILITMLGVTLVHSTTTNNMTTTLLPFLVLQLHSLLGVQFEGKHDLQANSDWSTSVLNCSCSKFSEQTTQTEDNNELEHKHERESCYEVRRMPPRPRPGPRPRRRRTESAEAEATRDYKRDEKFIPAKIVVNVATVTVNSSSATKSRPMCPRQRIRLRLRLRLRHEHSGVGARTLADFASTSACSDNDPIQLIPKPLSRNSSVKPLPLQCCSACSCSSVFNNISGRSSRESERNSEFSQILFILLRLLPLPRSSSKNVTNIMQLQLARNGAARSSVQQALLLLHCRRLAAAAAADSRQSDSLSFRSLPFQKLKLRARLRQAFLKLIFLLWVGVRLCVNEGKTTGSGPRGRSRRRHCSTVCVDGDTDLDGVDDCCYWKLRYYILRKWRRIRKGSRFKGDSRLNLLLFLLPSLKLLRLQRRIRISVSTCMTMARSRSMTSRRSTCNRTRKANKVHNDRLRSNILTIINTNRLRHCSESSDEVGLQSYRYCSSSITGTRCYCCRTPLGLGSVGLQISKSFTGRMIYYYYSVKWWLRFRRTSAAPAVDGFLLPKSCNNSKGCARSTLSHCNYLNYAVTSSTTTKSVNAT